LGDRQLLSFWQLPDDFPALLVGHRGPVHDLFRCPGAADAEPAVGIHGADLHTGVGHFLALVFHLVI